MAEGATYTIHLEGLEVHMGLGIHPEERTGPQRILVNVSMVCRYAAVPQDRIDQVVDYDFLRLGIQEMVATRHFDLQETFCEEVARLALRDSRVTRVHVRSQKPDIYPDARIGCEIERDRI